MVGLKWVIGLIAIAGALCGTSTAADDSESAKLVGELAGRYDFFADADRKTKFERREEPLLKYTNPIQGDVYGHVYVWTHRGRPEVIGAIFDHRTQGTAYAELHTLARAGVVGCRDGREFWKPSNAGVTFRAVLGAPAPAATAAARLLQLRELSRGFSVERDHPADGKQAMRLMPHPIFRYASPETDTLDGAIFLFIDGTTDPEAYLLLEASGADRKTWQFAFARMNLVAFRAEYRGELVWQVKRVGWDVVYDRHEPYAIIHEKAQRGLVRKP
jgi:hypothetical protein